MALDWLHNDKAEFRLFAAVLILKVSDLVSLSFSFSVDKLIAWLFIILLTSVFFVLLMML
jgi:hypothetical protein